MHRSKTCDTLASRNALTFASTFTAQTRTVTDRRVRHALAVRMFDDLVAIGGEPAPDPIPNSAVKTPSAYDTMSQDMGKSVAARSSNIRNSRQLQSSESKFF